MPRANLSDYPVLVRFKAGELREALPSRSCLRTETGIEAALRCPDEQDREALLTIIATQVHHEMAYLRQLQELSDLRGVVQGTRPGYLEAQEHMTAARAAVRAVRQRLTDARQRIEKDTPDHASVGELFRLEHDVGGALMSLTTSAQRVHDAFTVRPAGEASAE